MAQESFYFYDLETSGTNPRSSRIMQFAGQRTDLNLKPIAEPDNILIKLTDDVLPEPDAILITGITPQATRADGITEAEFLKYFYENVALPGTIFVGFNNVRFDDEFIRFINYRNFHDAYEWSWQDNRSRWDMLDVVRMTRALRPDGIEWPYDTDGRPSNRLGLLTAVNSLEHENAHDALSDVHATIAVARLIRNKQPKLFDYLLSMRGKNKVKDLAEANKMFVYVSGKYPSAYQKATVVTALGNHPGKQGVLVFDLRRDPADLAKMTVEELVTAWQTRVEDETKRFPIKTLQFNRCPAVAPLGVLDDSSYERLKLDQKELQKNYKALSKYPNLYNNLLEALKIMDKQKQTGLLANPKDVDSQLYDGFFEDSDRTAMSVVRAAESDEIGSLDIEFNDPRLTELLPLYKARNFPKILSQDEKEAWDNFCRHKLIDGAEKSLAAIYFARLSELGAQDLSKEKQYLLTELQLYGESICTSAEL